MGAFVLVKRPYRSWRKWAILFTLISSPAWAHSWYDPWCCNERDCTEYTGTVVEGPDGYKLENGLFVKYPDARVSQDSDFHICIYHGELRCFYAPQRTF